MGNHIESVNVHDWTRICTNFNPCRQRCLSRAQREALRVAEIVGAGDLTAIYDESRADGYIGLCRLSYGEWEPIFGEGARNFEGIPEELAEERDSRTVRVTCGHGRKDAWVEITYGDAADAQKVLAVARMKKDAWDQAHKAA